MERKKEANLISSTRLMFPVASQVCMYIYIKISMFRPITGTQFSCFTGTLLVQKYKYADAARRITGLHILEIFFDGIHVPVSPLLFDVKSAICADENMFADPLDGKCIHIAGNRTMPALGNSAYSRCQLPFSWTELIKV